MPPFQFVEINGLRLPSPQHAYSALYEVRCQASKQLACMMRKQARKLATCLAQSVV